MPAVASVARQEGISLVLNKDETPTQSRSLADLFALIRTRQVLYSTPSLDITARVIEKLDLVMFFFLINKFIWGEKNQGMFI